MGHATDSFPGIRSKGPNRIACLRIQPQKIWHRSAAPWDALSGARPVSSVTLVPTFKGKRHRQGNLREVIWKVPRPYFTCSHPLEIKNSVRAPPISAAGFAASTRTTRVATHFFDPTCRRFLGTRPREGDGNSTVLYAGSSQSTSMLSSHPTVRASSPQGTTATISTRYQTIFHCCKADTPSGIFPRPFRVNDKWPVPNAYLVSPTIRLARFPYYKASSSTARQRVHQFVTALLPTASQPPIFPSKPSKAFHHEQHLPSLDLCQPPAI